MSRFFLNILAMVNNQLTSLKSPTGDLGILSDVGNADSVPLEDTKTKLRVFNTMLFPGKHDADHANMPDASLFDSRGQEVTIKAMIYGVARWGQWYDYIMSPEPKNSGDVNTATYIRFEHCK
jgi:hypothetical protein